MKNRLSLFLSVLFVFSALFLKAQTDPPKCDNERYQNAKLSEDEFKDFNAALDDACKEINKGNYTKAISFLEAAYQKKDAEFVNQEIQKLKEYLNELATNPALKQDTVTPEKQQDQSLVVTEPPVEKKQEEIKTEEKPIAPQVESTDTKKTPPVEKTEQPQPETKVTEPAPPAQTEDPAKTEEQVTEPEKGISDAGKAQSSPTTETPASPETKTVETSATTEQIAPPAGNVAEENTDDAVVKTFSDEQKTDFQKKGLAKVKQFEQYINTICSKQTSAEMASQITDNALKLFYNPDDNYVEVSSKNRPGKRRLKVQNYLEKLRLLNYDNVIIEWAELNYASDFEKAPDGSYRAYIITRQRFTAMKDNSVTYEDVVTKRIEITITQYQKAVDGVLMDNYDVFLGDISVDHTE